MSTAAQREEFLRASKTHYEADMLLKGTYGDAWGDDFKGCSIGCHLRHIFPHAGPPPWAAARHLHSIVAEYYGYPEWLARLQDQVFESLPADEAAKWHVHLAEALYKLPDDYDWKRAMHRVSAAILRVLLPDAGPARREVEAIIEVNDRAAKEKTIPDETLPVSQRNVETVETPLSVVLTRWIDWETAHIGEWRYPDFWFETVAAKSLLQNVFQEIRDGILAALAATFEENAK